MSQRRLRILLVMLATTSTLACAESTTLEPTPTPVTSTIQPTSVSHLVPTPRTTAFEVALSAANGDRLVWRQAGGIRRIDVIRGSGSEVGGIFSVESEFGDGAFGERSKRCVWGSTTVDGSYFVGCGASGLVGPGLDALGTLLGATTKQSYRGPEISGSETTCYVIMNETIRGEICLDSTTGVPLKLSTASSVRGSLNAEFIASAVPGTLTSVPVGVSENFEGTASGTTLGLPDPLG